MNIYLLVLPAGSKIAAPDLAHDRVPRSLHLDGTSWARNWMILRLAGLILLGVAVITLIDRLLPQ